MPRYENDETAKRATSAVDKLMESLARYSSACTEMRMAEAIGEERGSGLWARAETKRHEAAERCRAAFEELLAIAAVLS